VEAENKKQARAMKAEPLVYNLTGTTDRAGCSNGADPVQIVVDQYFGLCYNMHMITWRTL